MALVFISHAHKDEEIARKLSALLGAGLGLGSGDFFLSSEAGHGVAPSAGIRATIAGELRQVRTLVVLLTPNAARSAWVWLEAGERLGCAGEKAPPIFVVPTADHVPLLAPVADLRSLRLDSDGELHELVRAVATSTDRKVVDVLHYKSALEDVLDCAKERYGAAAERRQRTLSWLRSHAAALLLAVLGLATLGYGGWLAASAPDPTNSAAALSSDPAVIVLVNDAIAKSASRYLVLKGRVLAGTDNVHNAVVMVSGAEVQDAATCREPECVKATTTTEGQFTLDLTKINAGNGDRVILSVAADGFKFFSHELVVDVRAMDAGIAPQNVTLVAAAHTPAQ